MNLGNRLKKLRLERNKTQEQIAKILGVASNTVSNWENGNRSPDDDMIVKIANYYDVSIDYLYGRLENIIIAGSTKNDIDLSDLPEEDKKLIQMMINKLRNKNK